MNKLITAMLIGVALMLSGCASVPMASKEADAQSKQFTVPADNKASIYIYRDSGFGGALKKMVSIDGQQIGETASGTYFHIFATPGQRKLSTQSEFGSNDLMVTAEAGKVIYVRNYMKMGVFIGGANLEIIDESEAKKAIVDNCTLAQPLHNKAVY